MNAPEKNESFSHFLKLLLLTVVIWLVLVGPAYYFSGSLGVEGLTLSAFLCLIPGWLVFWIVSRYGDASNFVMASFAGTMVRMFFVLGGVMIVKALGRYPRDTDFLVWVVLVFLALLAVETLLLVKQLQSVDTTESISEPENSRSHTEKKS